MLRIVFRELELFKSVFSRNRTWLWFCLTTVACMGNCDPLGGVSGLARTLRLDGSVYGSLLSFFQSTAINSQSLHLQIFSWRRSRFKGLIVTVGGKELLILDAILLVQLMKKAAKLYYYLPA